MEQITSEMTNDNKWEKTCTVRNTLLLWKMEIFSVIKKQLFTP